MSFESNLKSLIAQATAEYDNIARNDPVIESKDDDTDRGDQLDIILEMQKGERNRLWNELYELEEKRVEKGKNQIISNPEPTDRKELLKLITLDKQIVEKVEKEMSKVSLEDRPEDTVLEIMYRERLNTQVEQLEIALKTLKNEIKETERAIQDENQIIKECREITIELAEREASLKTELQLKSTSMDKLRVELVLLQKKYEVDIRGMSEFLDDNYPPHPVDGSEGPFGDLCDLKILLEQLLNEAYRNPENPYLPLRKGEYWSPYIETLIKGGIAKYHPEDVTLLCLENFRISE